MSNSKTYEGMFLVQAGSDFHAASQPVNTVLERSDDGDIRIDIDGQDESIYRNPGHGPEQWGGLGGWERCSADEIAAVLGTILDEGLIMEMRVDNQYGDSTIMIDSPDGLDPYIEVMPDGSRQIEFRRIDRTGRMFLF